jgi:HEAT repeat protein
MGALDSIKRLGPKGKQASRGLCVALTDRQQAVAVEAATTLKVVNPGLHERVMPLLVDRNYNVRSQALGQLAAMGEEGAPAVPVLIYFKDVVLHGAQPAFAPARQYNFNPDAGRVVQALFAVAPKDESWNSHLGKWFLLDPNPHVRAVAAGLLGQVLEPKAAANLLLKGMKQETNESVGIRIINALGELGENGKAAEKALGQMASASTSSAVRQAAEQALKRIGAEP